MRQSDRSGSFFSKLKTFIKAHPAQLFLALLFAVLSAATLAVCLPELIGRISYEGQEIGNWDTYLYYTVGHALKEGKIPYADMYENKPPMIFLLASLSYNFTGGYRLVNFFSAFAFLTILLIPLLFVVLIWKKKKPNALFASFVFLFVLGSAAFFTIYAEDRSGEVQIEALGSACVLLSLFFAALTETRFPRRISFYSPKVVLNGVFLGLGIMFKEPFLLVGAASVLLFCHSKKDLLYKFFFPLCYAGVTCVVVLLSAGCILPYFTIYIKNMFSAHITKYGSPLKRMQNVGKLFADMTNFSFALPLLVAFALLAVVYSECAKKYAKGDVRKFFFKFLNALKPLAALYAASFAVGLGGQYYNHHYIFALPYYLALLLCTADALLSVNVGALPAFNGLSQKSQKALTAFPLLMCIFALSIFTAAGFRQRPAYKQNDGVIERVRTLKEDAAYLDGVLDAAGEETYLWIGFNGYNPYAFTKHLPSGPCFAQDPYNFREEDGFFADSFKKQLSGVNVIVFCRLDVGVITQETEAYIRENFTVTVPESVAKARLTAPETFVWKLYFRTDAFF